MRDDNQNRMSFEEGKTALRNLTEKALRAGDQTFYKALMEAYRQSGIKCREVNLNFIYFIPSKDNNRRANNLSPRLRSSHLHGSRTSFKALGKTSIGKCRNDNIFGGKFS